jgi:AraC-like DNA-binding protein
VNTKLKYEQNWPELAQQANWSVSKLAIKCGVSIRTLEQYFLKIMGKPPKTWMAEQRQFQAIKLLSSGCSVKETAIELGYQHPQHFSREFKKQYSCCPTKFNQKMTGSISPRVRV